MPTRIRVKVNSNHRKAPNRKHFPVLSAAIAVIVVFCLVFALSIAVYISRNKLPGGVTVEGWEPGSISIDEFSRQLLRKSDELLQNKLALATNFPGNRAAQNSFTFRQLGLHMDVESVISTMDELKTGTLWDRFWKRRKLQKHITLRMDIDAAQLEAALERAWPGSLSIPPENARRIITEEDTVVLKDGENGFRWNEQTLRDTLAAEAKRLFSGEASIQANPIPIPYDTVKPKVTLDMLKKEGIERKISQFSTPLAGSEDGRIHNVQITAQTVNGMIIPPGGTFDFAQVVERTKKRDAYQNAPVIINGHLAPGIGGGICQVSSTLYNAALLSGLDIVERRNHSRPVSYLAKGLDATFAEGFINFKFRNNTDSHLLIKSEMEQNRLTIKLFGDIPKELSYSVETKFIETVPPPVKIMKNPDLQPGKQVILQTGKPGYIVETYRTTKKNGTVVKKERLSRDLYKPQPTLIAANNGVEGGGSATERNGSRSNESTPPKKPIVEDGVEGPNY